MHCKWTHSDHEQACPLKCTGRWSFRMASINPLGDSCLQNIKMYAQIIFKSVYIFFLWQINDDDDENAFSLQVKHSAEVDI